MSPPEAVREALDRLAHLAEVMGRRNLLVTFRDLASAVDDDPLIGARRVLAHFDDGLDRAFRPDGGYQYLPDGPLRDASFESAALRFELYQAAIALWHEAKPRRSTVDLQAIGRAGGEIVLRDGRYFVRYDAGAHAPIMREDEISLEQAQQAELGAMHFAIMLIGLQRDLTAKGVDCHVSNFDLLKSQSQGRSP